MTSGFLKSTTALVLMASMAVTPVATYAQSGDAANQEETEAERLLRLKLEEEAAKAGQEGEALINQATDALRGTAPEVDAPAADAAPVEEAPATETAEETPAPEAESAPEVTEETAPEMDAPEPAPEVAEEPAPDAGAAEPEAAETETTSPAPEIAEEEPPAPEIEPMAPEAEAVVQDAPDAPESVVEQGSNALRGTADAEPMDSEAQAEAQAEADAAATGSLAASTEGEGEAEVVEETVTEDTARSSNEEFETDLQGAAREGLVTRADDDDDDDGLSNFEKAAILGLGAVAIGSLLRKDESVAANTGDRIIVERDGQYRVIKNDDALLRQPGSDVKTYRYDDGSTRTVVTRTDGIEVETVRAADGRVLRRTRTLEDGTTVVLFDDTRTSQAVVVGDLPQVGDRRTVDFGEVSADDLAATLATAQAVNVNRTFSLSQIRNIDAVRQLVPEINVDTINFETNSAVIRPDEAEELAALGNAMRRIIADNPSEVFLVEGHTDAVGAGSYNLALSDRRAESVALALTEYFDVPPENLVVQGYGESDLLIRTPEAERVNRRAAVRRITPLLDGSI